MAERGYKVYGYRWVMMLAFMLIVMINQMMWISFAPITGEATGHFGVTELEIGLLSMSFMIVFNGMNAYSCFGVDQIHNQTGICPSHMVNADSFSCFSLRPFLPQPITSMSVLTVT